MDVMTADGSSLAHRHVEVLVDMMCRSGAMLPMSRHGMSRAGLPTLQRASFEETRSVFSTAALFKRTDPLVGVTDSVLLGQRSLVGTGTVNLVSDPTAIRSAYDPGRDLATDLRACKDEDGDDDLYGDAFAMDTAFGGDFSMPTTFVDSLAVSYTHLRAHET